MRTTINPDVNMNQCHSTGNPDSLPVTVRNVITAVKMGVSGGIAPRWALGM
jgi:hypothetical protein